MVDNKDDLADGGREWGSIVFPVIGAIFLVMAGYVAYKHLFFMDCPALIKIPADRNAGFGYDESRDMLVVFQSLPDDAPARPAIRYNFSVDRRCMKMVEVVNETTGQRQYDIAYSPVNGILEPEIEWVSVRKR